jgi:hypothetical protein
VCSWTKATKQINEDDDMLLEDFVLLTAILIIAQVLYPNLCGLKAHSFHEICESLYFTIVIYPAWNGSFSQ